MSKLTETRPMRIWWIPQLGMKQAFHQEVGSLREAKLVLHCLAQYDLFQLEHNVKPDYCNAGGLQVFVGHDVGYKTDDGWEDWEDEDGYGINEHELEELA